MLIILPIMLCCTVKSSLSMSITAQYLPIMLNYTHCLFYY